MFRAAWIFLGLEYTVLAIYSALKESHLNLPTEVSGRLVSAFLARSLGMLICAAIYVVRLSSMTPSNDQLGAAGCAI